MGNEFLTEKPPYNRIACEFFQDLETNLQAITKEIPEAEFGSLGLQVVVYEVVQSDANTTLINYATDESSDENLYLASVFKPLMVLALMRLAESNKVDLNAEDQITKHMYNLASQVIKISNDADLAKLRDEVGEIIHALNQTPFGTKNATQTAAEVIEKIISNWLSWDNNELIINRSLRSEEDGILPNSIKGINQLIKAYDELWSLVDTYKNDKLLNLLKEVLSSNVDPKDSSKSHDINNGLREGLPKATVFGKGGNATLYVQDGKLSFEKGQGYADVYTCVSRVILDDEREFRIIYYVKIPFTIKNGCFNSILGAWTNVQEDKRISKLIRGALNPVLDNFVGHLVSIIKNQN